MTRKKIASVAIAVVIVLTMFLSLSGCNYEFVPLLKQGYFVYKYVPVKDADGKTIGKEAVICGLSKTGKTQKYIVVPETLDGHNVIDIAYYNGISGESFWESEVLEKIYLTKKYPCKNTYIFNELKHRQKLVIFCDYRPYDIKNCDRYFSVQTEYTVKWEKANTTYYWNYENSPKDGIYWIDDWDNEKIEFVPQEPVREGFVFGGWYKEAECVNKWDFDNDIVPAKLYDESANRKDYIYVETALYAQWTATSPNL